MTQSWQKPFSISSRRKREDPVSFRIVAILCLLVLVAMCRLYLLPIWERQDREDFLRNKAKQHCVDLGYEWVDNECHPLREKK